ncbi:MAG: hypothetical protein H0V07_13945 [Propionibacteriales bacterium]|nr:hypothetical protein [Propionibacteriales bacterium]
MSHSAPPPPESGGTGYQPPLEETQATPYSSPNPGFPSGDAPSPAGGTPAGASSTARASSSSTSTAANPLADLHRFDLAQIGLGALLFVASLLPFYSYSFNGGALSVSQSYSAWHGFFGWFGVVLGVAAAGVLAVALLGNVAIPSLRLVVLGLFAASALCLLLALFVIPGGGYSGVNFSSGHSFGYWLALLCSLAGTALAFLRKDERVAVG